MRLGASDPQTRAEWFVLVPLALVVFLPRLANLAAFLNVDGCLWIKRSLHFVRALSTLNLAETYQASHPGVTLMIVSGATMCVGGLLQFGTLRLGEVVNELTLYAKLPVAILCGLGIFVTFSILRRLFARSWFPFVAVVVLALDPFFLAHSRYLQLDGLTAVLTLLALLLHFSHLKEGRTSLLVGSGICAGLAFLTKSYALALVPFVAVVQAWHAWYAPKPGGLVRLGKELLVWVAAAVAVFVLLWPAMWVAPLKTVHGMFAAARTGITHTHENVGSLEDSVRGTTGERRPRSIHFEPKLLEQFARSNPLLGLAVGSAALAALLIGPLRARRDTEFALVLYCALYFLYFLLGMSFAGKVFLRYCLVCFLLWNIVVAFGLNRLFGALRSTTVLPRYAKSLGVVVFCVLGLAHAQRVFSQHPYYDTYQNELFRIPDMYIGWGEGLREVALHLNRKEGAERLTVASFYPCVLGKYFEGKVVGLDAADSPEVEYVVLYSNQVGRYLYPRLVDRYYRDGRPEYTAVLNGREHAWLYESRVDAATSDTPVPRHAGQVREAVEHGVGRDAGECRPPAEVDPGVRGALVARDGY